MIGKKSEHRFGGVVCDREACLVGLARGREFVHRVGGVICRGPELVGRVRDPVVEGVIFGEEAGGG